MAGKRRGTTCYVVAYDIPDDARRTKVHKILSGFGEWTQYSLFECFLNDKERILLRDKLDRVLESEEDHVRFYPLCESCLVRVQTVGGHEPEERLAFVV